MEFDAGDHRVNQDWYVTSIHTLWIREHNRLAAKFASENDWNDEQIFLTTREVITCKMFLIALAYLRSYYVFSEMKREQGLDDSLQIERLAYGYTYLEISPLTKFGTLGLDPTGTHAAVASDEMSVGYRCHDLIPPKVNVYGPNDETLGTFPFLETCNNPTKFLELGLDAVLRGAIKTTLPGFHAGVQDSLRNAQFNVGDPKIKHPFDIAMWSVLRERTRGQPTFNEYFRYWNNAKRPGFFTRNPLQVDIRSSFADFTSNKDLQVKLAQMYENPDQVDLVVGLQLDEERFPGMQIPKSFVIVSLLSLFSLGISDRHGPLVNLMYCIVAPNYIDNCKATNVLQDILWEKKPLFGFPNRRRWNTAWLDEIDYQFQGNLALWRLVTKNSGVTCLQMNPLYVINEVNGGSVDTPYNPIVCNENDWKKAWKASSMHY